MTLLFTILLLIIIVLLIITLYAFVIGAPIFFTPKKAIRDGLKYCNPEAGSHFFELGAGTGRAMVVASKEFKLKSIGFELSPILFLLAKLNIFFFGKGEMNLLAKNFYKYNLKDADIIFCFLTPHAMEKLKSQFQKELKPGTRIISYSFSIPGWEPEKVIRNNYPGKVFVYKI
jgi:hypothetical protein